jgi:hypothetical protein
MYIYMHLTRLSEVGSLSKPRAWSMTERERERERERKKERERERE